MSQTIPTAKELRRAEMYIAGEYGRRFGRNYWMSPAWDKMRKDVANHPGVNVQRVYGLCVLMTLGHLTSRSIQSVAFGR